MVGASARPGGQLSGKPTLLLSGKEEADHPEASAERGQLDREPLRSGSTKRPITGVVACCARAASVRKLAPPDHSKTSLARAVKATGNVRPSSVAVLMLTVM